MSITQCFIPDIGSISDQYCERTVQFDDFICIWVSLSHMATNPHAMASDDTIVGSIDSTAASDEYVIADISADGAWLSMQADDAPTLPAWR